MHEKYRAIVTTTPRSTVEIDAYSLMEKVHNLLHLEGDRHRLIDSCIRSRRRRPSSLRFFIQGFIIIPTRFLYRIRSIFLIRPCQKLTTTDHLQRNSFSSLFRLTIYNQLYSICVWTLSASRQICADHFFTASR